MAERHEFMGNIDQLIDELQKVRRLVPPDENGRRPVAIELCMATDREVDNGIKYLEYDEGDILEVVEVKYDPATEAALIRVRPY